MLDVYQEFLGLQDELGTDFVVVLGDFLVGKNIKREWTRLKEIQEAHPKAKIFFVPGNHDIHPKKPDTLRFYLENVGPTNYTFLWKGVRFIGISSFDTGEYKRFSLSGVISDIVNEDSNQASDVNYSVLFMHHARWFSRQDRPSKNLNSYYDDRSEYWDNEVVPVLKKHNIRYVFGGDSIGYSFHERDGITYLLTGLPGWDFSLHHPTALQVNVLNTKLQPELLPFRLNAFDERYRDKGERKSTRSSWLNRFLKTFSAE